MAEHTKEPWTFHRDEDFSFDEITGFFVQGADGKEIFYADNDDRPETGGDLKRAAECVTALAGLNPAAVASLIEAAETMLQAVSDEPDYEAIDLAENALRTALTAIREPRHD